MNHLSIGIVGVTGAVGQEFLKLLAPFSLKKLVPMASMRSVGKTVVFQGQFVPIVEPTFEQFKGLDLVFFSAGASVSRQLAPLAVQAGAVVIDNSSAFRMENSVPLVIPEINATEIKRHQGIISVPNCTTIILWMGLYPIYQQVEIEQIWVSTYQAVSGAGQKGLDELEDQLLRLSEHRELNALKAFPHQIAFNALPQVDIFEEENGFTKEEMKLVRESQKILNNPTLRISGTCVRIPVKRAHSEAVFLRTKMPIQKETLRNAYEKMSGVCFFSKAQEYPHPLQCSGRNEVLVGRFRQDLQDPCGYHLWIVGDQLLKGASLNALQIAQHLFKERG